MIFLSLIVYLTRLLRSLSIIYNFETRVSPFIKTKLEWSNINLLNEFDLNNDLS